MNSKAKLHRNLPPPNKRISLIRFNEIELTIKEEEEEDATILK